MPFLVEFECDAQDDCQSQVLGCVLNEQNYNCCTNTPIARGLKNSIGKLRNYFSIIARILLHSVTVFPDEASFLGPVDKKYAGAC